MPARRNIKRIRPFGKRGTKLKKLLVVLVIVIFSVVVYKIFFNKKFWTGEDRVSVVTADGNGAIILIFDPVSEEITKILVPGETQVEVAKNLGVWKIKSVWELGENEGQYGTLLARSITRTFNFPVFLWSEDKILGLASNNPLDILKATFSLFKTNLSLGDKVSIGLFSLNVRNANKKFIDLGKTTLLKKSTLADGGLGYVASNLDSPAISSKFADYRVSYRDFRIQIKDATGGGVWAEEVSEVIEVFGAKVASILNVDKKEIACEVKSKDQEVGKRISLTLGCNQTEDVPEGNFDMEIILGEEFTI